VPLNRHSAPFLLDGAASVGVCGDWFTPAPECRGPSIESAYLSGQKLADAVAQNLADKSTNKDRDYGLDPIHFFEVRESNRNNLFTSKTMAVVACLFFHFELASACVVLHVFVCCVTLPCTHVRRAV
jgi:hypothetical protein